MDTVLKKIFIFYYEYAVSTRARTPASTKLQISMSLQGVANGGNVAISCDIVPGDRHGRVTPSR